MTRLNESQFADWRNQNVGFVFQTFNLIPVLTAYENVELPLLLTRLSRSERRQQVETALELVGLADRRAICRANFPAARSSAWPSPGRW